MTVTSVLDDPVYCTVLALGSHRAVVGSTHARTDRQKSGLAGACRPGLAAAELTPAMPLAGHGITQIYRAYWDNNQVT